MYDQANDLLVRVALKPKANLGAANVTGETIDRQGFEAVTFAVALAASGDTLSGSLKLDFDMEESDDGGTWADVTAGDVICPAQSALVAVAANGVVLTVDAAAEADKAYAVGYKGGKRYVRLNSTKTGTHTSGIPGGVVAILGQAARYPVS